MLAGREAEQRRIDQLLQQAMAGSSGVLVLRGDPGIGKTTLIDYAASRAGSMRVLRATGIEAENDLGFAGLYSLLRPVADYLKGLPEPHAAALRCALGLDYDKGPPDRLAVAAGTHGLLTTVAEVEPLLILVDDLHWLDPGSKEALLFALHRLDRDAIACLLTLGRQPTADETRPFLQGARWPAVPGGDRARPRCGGASRRSRGRDQAGPRDGQAAVRRNRR